SPANASAGSRCAPRISMRDVAHFASSVGRRFRLPTDVAHALVLAAPAIMPVLGGASTRRGRHLRSPRLRLHFPVVSEGGRSRANKWEKVAVWVARAAADIRIPCVLRYAPARVPVRQARVFRWHCVRKDRDENVPSAARTAREHPTPSQEASRRVSCSQ